MGVYAKATRKYKKSTRKTKVSRKTVATKRDLMQLSKQVSNTREMKEAYAIQSFKFGGYAADNFSGIFNTYKTLTLGIDSIEGPGISAGVLNGQRIGSEIRVKQVTLKMTFLPSAVDPVTNPIPRPQIIRLYFGYSKSQLGRAFQSLPQGAGDFFKFGGVNQPPTGSVIDLNKDVNNDLYTITRISKDIKIGNAAYFQGQPAVQDYNNNDFKLFQHVNFDLTKLVLKNQKFNENDDAASNRGLYCYVTAVSADGAAYVGKPIECTYELCYKYTDA